MFTLNVKKYQDNGNKSFIVEKEKDGAKFFY
jgi:hypothetical protein